MMRVTYLIFGTIAYLVFFATFLYLIAFVGALPWLPHTVDRGNLVAPFAPSLAADLGLVALFGLQHSVMARRGFKQAWSRMVPPPIERSVFVLLASLALCLLFWLWQPLPNTVWHVRDAVAAALIWGLFAAGWGIVLISTFLISHFELFGLKQVWMHARSVPAVEPVFRQPFFYRWVRHPIYSGFFLAFWATPHMTVGHLVLALGLSAYMLVGIHHEERDLVRMFGPGYEAYRGRVGMLAPRLRRPAG